MIALRPLAGADIARIAAWPPYPPEFGELDYALRAGGWLAEFHGKPSARCHVAEENGEAVGFILLSMTGADEAEFRIALRADKLGRGLGEAITRATLELGFSGMGLARIHLIVRKTNPRAERLYRRLGFVATGERRIEVRGRATAFTEMEIRRSSAWRRPPAGK